MRQEAKIIPHPAVRRREESTRRLNPVPRSPFSAVILLLFVWLLLAVAVFAVHRDTGLRIVQENGPVETATVVFYGVACVLLILAARRGAGATGYLSALFMVVLALRELDFHYRFTARGIDQLYFYTDPAIPTGTKVLVVSILAAIAVVAVVIVLRGFGILRAARQRRPYAVTALAGILLLPLSPILDQVHYHVTANMGRAGDSGIAFAIIVLEETLELLIPALFMIATAQWIWRKDRDQAAADR